jgi:hypothetical protein
MIFEGRPLFCSLGERAKKTFSENFIDFSLPSRSTGKFEANRTKLFLKFLLSFLAGHKRCVLTKKFEILFVLSLTKGQSKRKSVPKRAKRFAIR